MNDQNRDEPRHPMAVVSQRTGLTSHAIRAWERRYGVVNPARSTGGHRLYSDEHVERLRLLHRLTLGGRQIGQIAELSDDELESLVREDEAAGLDVPTAGGGSAAAKDTTAFAAEAMSAVAALDAERLDALLRRAAIALEPTAFLDRLMLPLLSRIGEAWARSELTPAHEHLASAVVSRVGGWLLDSLEPVGDTPTLVAATPSGQRHELGALAAAVAASSAGWRVRYLGPDLPAADIAGAASDSDARVVALSLVYTDDNGLVDAELRALRHSVPSVLPIIAGGRAADHYDRSLERIAAVRMETFEELRSYLTVLKRRTGDLASGPW